MKMGQSKFNFANGVVMSDLKLCLIRPPALPAYQDTDIKEDPMITSLIGYLDSIHFPRENIDVFDFQLDRSINYDHLLARKYDSYILATRDLGESYRYSLRMSQKLSTDTLGKIYIYGQIAPLKDKQLPKRVSLSIQDEKTLARSLDLNFNGDDFTENLSYKSYFDLINLENWQLERRKGAIETTRGCPYKCKFCFISAGDSYAKRWQVRPIDSIMKDLKSYIGKGIRSFVFLDSEFLGLNPSYHRQKEILLNRIINELPPIRYMILCRADTLLKFDQFELFRKSGLKKILVGVESLYQNDLDSLRKDSTVNQMMEGIKRLIEIEVECCLTYLTFHRNTTIQGLRENLNNIKVLYAHPKAKYLGMPNFSFNMEVVRDNNEAANELSDLTYIKPLLEARGQNNSKALFPVELEPLIEIFRLLQYEWAVKKNELIRAKHSSTEAEKNAIHNWFDNLGKFCIDMMEYYLDRFENGQVTFGTLLSEKEQLFQFYKDFYSTLPKRLQKLSTYDSHAASIDYQRTLMMEDHGWDTIIPPLPPMKSGTVKTW